VSPNSAHFGNYDVIGRGYSGQRQADPRIGSLITDALGDAASVVDVGAGPGSYEPDDRFVVAVEPSAVMIAQRPAAAASVVQGVAEALPFADGAFDAAMAVLTVHHWADRQAGYAELRRVARRCVVLTFEPALHRDFWLVRDYLPDMPLPDMTVAETADALGASEVVPVPLPADCTDAVLPAHWSRPEAYLDPAVQAANSGMAAMDVGPGMRRLADDLASGEWHRRYGKLLRQASYDAGFRLVLGGG